MRFEKIKKLKPFFNFEIKTLEDGLSLLLGISVFSIIVFLAVFVDVTYDEAYTYLNTGRIQDVWKIYQFRIANTHILNSVLMSISTLLLPYNDFAIRLPSVLISAFYISIAISFSKLFKSRLIVLGLLLLFFFMIEFMALGRGYGMSATFILAALFVFKNRQIFKSFHLWIVYLLLLAIYSNYVAIVPSFAIVAYLFVFHFKWKIPETPKKNKRWIVGLLVLALYGFYSVTLAGKPLYGAYNQSFFEAVPLNLLTLFFGEAKFSLSLVTWATVIFIMVVLSIFIFSRHKNKIGIITLFTFLTIVLMAWVGSKPLPTGRVLIPFWPLIVLTFVEVLERLISKFKIPNVIVKGLNLVVLAALIYNFQAQINYSEMIQVKSNQWKRPIAMLSEYGKDLDPDETYYLEKDKYHHTVINKLASVKPSEVKNEKYFQSKKYNSLSVISLSFPIKKNKEFIWRQVRLGNTIVYNDTISLNENSYQFKNENILLLPFPNINGDQLSIGNVDGTWSTNYEIGVTPK